MMKYIPKNINNNSVFELFLKLFYDRHNGQEKIIHIFFYFFSLQSQPSSSSENNTDDPFSPDDDSLGNVNGKKKKKIMGCSSGLQNFSLRSQLKS